MKKLSPKLIKAYRIAFEQEKVAKGSVSDALKWLRYYLDFCHKYGHRPRETDSLPLYLQKLASKNQSPEQQAEAAASIQRFYQLVSAWVDAPQETEILSHEEAAWELIQNQLKQSIQLKQYSRATLRTYSGWVSRFQRYLNSKDPIQVDSEDAKNFLTYLAVEKKVVATTQNQAFNSLLYLYRHVLKRDYDLKDKVTRARKSRYIPVVLSRAEVDTLLPNLAHPYRLVITCMYACGLRLKEGLGLRLQSLNFDLGVITIHEGKGRKDRTVPMSDALVDELQEQVGRVKVLHQQDLDANYAGVFMPGAYDRKASGAAKELPWQWLFPAKTLTLVPESGERRRYHMHETQLQKALRAAVRKTALHKRVTSHTFRHSYATHLLQAGYDIQTIQKLLGHANIQTTMVYLHTMRTKTKKDVASPLDLSPEEIDGS